MKEFHLLREEDLELFALQLRFPSLEHAQVLDSPNSEVVGIKARHPAKEIQE